MSRSTVLFRRFMYAVAALLILQGTAWSQGFDDSKAKHVGYPKWFKQGFFDLKSDLDEALAHNKKGLMVLFTTEGCSYCDIFILKSLGDPVLAATVQKHFDSVGLEIFDDAEMTTPRGKEMRVKHFAKAERVGFSPTLLFYGKDGELMLRAIGYQSPARFRLLLDYVIGDYYRTETLSHYVRRHEKKTPAVRAAGGLKRDPLFAASPAVLDRSRQAASRPLMVIFAEANCGDCEALHDKVLAVPEVRSLLKRFDIVQLDATDNTTMLVAPGGKRVTARRWYETAGYSRLPALAFFDEKGNEVLATDALVLRQRMMNSLNYVLERAYEKGWTYQRFARTKAIERNLKKKK